MTTSRKWGVTIGDTAHKTFFEFFTLILALLAWSNYATSEVLNLIGDNTGSLQDALEMKGKGNLNLLARELSWRKAYWDLHFQVGHIPSESNVIADALSRVTQGASIPTALHGVFRLEDVLPKNFWATLQAPSASSSTSTRS